MRRDKGKSKAELVFAFAAIDALSAGLGRIRMLEMVDAACTAFEVTNGLRERSKTTKKKGTK